MKYLSENEEGVAFQVFFEKQSVLKCDRLLDAVAASFGLYFILNLEYPKEISCFLEMIQRYFLKIHPDNGIKSKKNNSSKKKSFL